MTTEYATVGEIRSLHRSKSSKLRQKARHEQCQTIFADAAAPYIAAALEADVAKLHGIDDVLEASAFVRDTIVPAMADLRSAADQAETLTAESYYPFPAYDQLLFGV